jgi:hypothetical protein
MCEKIRLSGFPRARICQFVFEKCDGHATYQGRFVGQVKP